MGEKIYDLVVIGGGINGVGIAVDAQGRGLETAVVEKADLASGTSSASSKLIHGGLRYLEHFEFRLVRESLREREVLLKKAPHLVAPMRFILPHSNRLRPAWLIRAGLFLYDVLAKRDALPSSRFVRFLPESSPLKDEFVKGFEYSDCWTDDARLVVANAIQCQQLGGDILARHECIGLEQGAVSGQWNVTVNNTLNGETRVLKARAVVNAAGPWVNTMATTGVSSAAQQKLMLVRGSHIVVPRLFEGDKAYVLQNTDGRIVFVIPYLEDFTLIGTTDVEHESSADDVHIADTEVTYLCKTVNRYFKHAISSDDVVWSYSGVRALFDESHDSLHKMSRDYSLEVTLAGDAPMLTIYGGKLTTYRRLAEAALDKLSPYFPEMKKPWTENSLLPGGDMGMDAGLYGQKLTREYPFLTARTVKRLVSAYGSRAKLFLGSAEKLDDLGEHFGHQFTAAEVDYLLRYEFAATVEDVLWRRSKMGLLLDNKQQGQLAVYIASARHGRLVKSTAGMS